MHISTRIETDYNFITLIQHDLIELGVREIVDTQIKSNTYLIPILLSWNTISVRQSASHLMKL